MELKQLSLPITWSFSRNIRDFVVSDCNRYAFEFLEKWPFKIQSNFVCIVGEKSSGKTHLAHIWADRLGADFMTSSAIFNKWYSIASEENPQKYFVLDDADELHEDLLFFYLYNTIVEKKAFLLMTAKRYPNNWDLKFEDIRSRISTVDVVRIQKPNESAMNSIIDKMLLQRGIQSSQNVIEYISNRIERSYESINYWIKEIDSRLRKSGTKLNLPLVREILN